MKRKLFLLFLAAAVFLMLAPVSPCNAMEPDTSKGFKAGYEYENSDVDVDVQESYTGEWMGVVESGSETGDGDVEINRHVAVLQAGWGWGSVRGKIGGGSLKEKTIIPPSSPEFPPSVVELVHDDATVVGVGGTLQLVGDQELWHPDVLGFLYIDGEWNHQENDVTDYKEDGVSVQQFIAEEFPGYDVGVAISGSTEVNEWNIGPMAKVVYKWVRVFGGAKYFKLSADSSARADVSVNGSKVGHYQDEYERDAEGSWFFPLGVALQTDPMPVTLPLIGDADFTVGVAYAHNFGGKTSDVVGAGGKLSW